MSNLEDTSFGFNTDVQDAIRSENSAAGPGDLVTWAITNIQQTSTLADDSYDTDGTVNGTSVDSGGTPGRLFSKSTVMKFPPARRSFSISRIPTTA